MSLRLPEFATAALLSLALAAPAIAGPAEDKGLQIAREAEARDEGFVDSQSSMEMVLRNRAGKESRRALRSKTLERSDDGDWSLIVFDTPRDVKGTALLSYTHKAGPDDQWLYLPALKRVKRIASNNKSGPFMGSEFSYEDISSPEIEKYTYKFLRDDSLDGKKVFVVERYPTDPKSGYSRQVAWIDQAEYRVWQTEFYDRKGDLLKTLTAHDYAQYAGKHWRPGKLSMVNHQTGKSTDLMFTEYAFKNGFEERDFDQASLKRAR